MRRRSRVGSIVTYSVAVIMVLIVILPLLWIFLMSLKTPDEIIKWPPSILFKPTLENYIGIFQPSYHHLDFTKVFFNSIIITFTSLAVAIALASISAYAISRLRPRGWKILNFIILGVSLAVAIALVVPLYIIWGELNLLDTRIGLIIPFIALNIPLATWLLEGFFIDIPKNLEDAAVIDGCSPFEAFLR